MNDLNYRDWMKFQKSFFRHTTDQKLAEEFIYFFTKAVWPNGEPSRSLIMGVKNFNEAAMADHRMVETYRDVTSLADLTNRLSRLGSCAKQYDFILIDLRSSIQDSTSLSGFFTHTANRFFKSIKSLLVPRRYCTILIGTEQRHGGGFPLSWSVALAGRAHLRLRDEKIGLEESEGRVFYCLIMQADDDERPASQLTPKTLHTTDHCPDIPAWLIVKPPQRKKNEVLHPAKYPETLVVEFLKIFTKPGETVCDPMVGTGSTIVAAARTGCIGIGIDLNPNFTKIATQRLAECALLSPFEDAERRTIILQGDSTRLTQMPELTGKTFNYVVTSPPYWSMLTNPGSENQANRRRRNLPLIYSESSNDLGNVRDYNEFLELLESVFFQISEKLINGGFLTVVVKNVKRNHTLHTLAWDLTARLCGLGGRYAYAGTTLWCQDDVGLKPFAVGIHWVSNILHHYCLHFRKRGNGQF